MKRHKCENFVIKYEEKWRGLGRDSLLSSAAIDSLQVINLRLRRHGNGKAKLRACVVPFFLSYRWFHDNFLLF